MLKHPGPLVPQEADQQPRQSTEKQTPGSEAGASGDDQRNPVQVQHQSPDQSLFIVFLS